MLTKEQEEFLTQNRAIFEKLIPLQKQLLEAKQPKKVEKKQDTVEKKKMIKQILEKMTLEDIDAFSNLMSDDIMKTNK